MYKKSILSVAIASSLMLTGCFENNKVNDENAGDVTNPPSGELTAELQAKLQLSYPIFSPATGDFPTPNDILIQKDSTATPAIEQSDGSFAIPGSDAEDASPPVFALENLSGASLTAPIDIEIGNALGLASVDPTTVNGTSFILTGAALPAPPVVPNPNQTVFLIELDYASDNPLAALSAGEAPTIEEATTAQSMALATSADLDEQAVGLAAIAEIQALAEAPKYDAEVIQRTNGDGVETNFIRINPLKPLNPAKRYVVAITDGVKDLNGESLIRHPGAAAYETLSDEDTGVANSALLPIQALVNGLWETVTETYFGLTNSSRAGASLPLLSEENIVFSYSFTTSNDTKVIDYMAEPNTWITDTLESLVKTSAAEAAIEAGASDYATIKTAVDAAYNGWTAESFNAALAGCDANPAGAARFACAGTALEGSLTGTFGLSFPKPAADTSMTFAGQRDLRAVSAAITDSIAAAGVVNVSEATLTVPYYLEKPNNRGTIDASIANLVMGWWKADAALATSINTIFNLDALDSTLPQAVPAEGSALVQSNIVNAFFPFPVNNGDVEIPVLAIYPADDTNKPDDGYKTIIYQHGITTDRSVALTLGSAIVANSGGKIAVIAIDQPLHGVDAASDGDKAIWAETFLAGAGIITTPDGVFDGEDADPADQDAIDAVVAGTFTIGALQQIQAAPCPALDGLDLTGTSPADIVTAIGEVQAGNCGAGAAATYAGAELIQNTVANSASTIPGLARDEDNERHFDFAGVNLQPVPMDFDGGTVGTSTNTALDQPNTGSGSMSINIANFLTSRDNFRQQIVDLLTLRLSVGNMDVDGDTVADLDADNVHFIGHSLGTLNGIPFVEIANQTATTADDIVTANFLTPGGNIARLAENSEAFAPSIFLGLNSAAGLERGDADLEAFLNVFQIAFDSFDPINFVGNMSSTTSTTKALFTEVVGDSTIPNSADPALDIVQPDELILLTVNGDFSVTKNVIANPVAGVSFGPGTDAPLAGTSPLETVSGAVAIDSSAALGINFLRFADDSGATHGSPVVGSPAVFGQIVESALSMVASDGASVAVSNTALIEDAD
ncbi:MAG: hypothetical protein ACMZ64_04400 [Oleiphilus sp.]